MNLRPVLKHAHFPELYAVLQLHATVFTTPFETGLLNDFIGVIVFLSMVKPPYNNKSCMVPCCAIYALDHMDAYKNALCMCMQSLRSSSNFVQGVSLYSLPINSSACSMSSHDGCVESLPSRRP